MKIEFSVTEPDNTRIAAFAEEPNGVFSPESIVSILDALSEGVLGTMGGEISDDGPSEEPKGFYVK